MLIEVEGALTNYLTNELTRQGIKVRPVPDNLKELRAPTQAGQVLIAYKQSSFRSVASNPLTYEQLLQFDINLQVKGLRSHVGVYPLLDQMRLLLAGWHCGSPAQKRPAYLQAERFIDVEEGMWSYSQSLIVPLTIAAGKVAEFPDLTAWEAQLTTATDWETLQQIAAELIG
jgi:hypothetical protein